MMRQWCSWMLVGGLMVGLVAPGISADSKKEKKKVSPAVKLDSSAEHIDVFEGIEKGVLEVKMIPKDSLGGNMLIENKGDKPLNVDFPAAFVGRQVLKQFGGQQGGGFGGGQQGGLGGGQGGGGQAQGGGLGGGQQGGGGGFGGGGQQGGGGGFFSIPPDRIIRVAYRSVCLEHGKTEPSPRMNYTIGKVQDFRNDPVLEEVLKMVASGQLDEQSAQAATWHVTDKMSWEQLAAKSTPHIGRPATPYFTPQQIARAQSIFSTAVARVNENKEVAKTAAAKSDRTRSTTIKRD